MVENTFDNNINGNTNNNVETRNTTEGVKTIKSLDQIIDEDIRSKLVEAIKNNHDGIFNLYTYNEETKLNICGYKISFIKTFHSIENFSVCIEDNNTKLVYSGDMGYYNIDEYSKVCKNADMFICESTFLSTDSNKSKYHLDAKEAATIAKISNVKKLLLTHTWPEYEKDLYLKEASTIYDKVYMAHENDVYVIENAQ